MDARRSTGRAAAMEARNARSTMINRSSSGRSINVIRPAGRSCSTRLESPSERAATSMVGGGSASAGGNASSAAKTSASEASMTLTSLGFLRPAAFCRGAELLRLLLGPFNDRAVGIVQQRPLRTARVAERDTQQPQQKPSAQPVAGGEFGDAPSAPDTCSHIRTRVKATGRLTARPPWTLR